MKINAIQPSYLNNISRGSCNNKQNNNVSFGIANSGKLKILFSYGLPCMYSGIEMIDPKKIQRLLKIKAFDGPIKDVINTIAPYEKSLNDIEGRVWQIVKDFAKDSPDSTVKETFQRISPIFDKRLRKKQAPIFHKLTEIAQDLPEGYKYKFKLFMHETENKLNGKPIVVKFSSKEFMYKLHKIGDDIAANKNLKSGRAMKKLFEETNNLTQDKSLKGNEANKQTILFMEKILNRSTLKNNEQLQNLFKESKQ